MEVKKITSITIENIMPLNNPNYSDRNVARNF